MQLVRGPPCGQGGVPSCWQKQAAATARQSESNTLNLLPAHACFHLLQRAAL